MKIGIFTEDFFPFVGGQGKNMMRIYNNLIKNNEVFVFSPCDNNLKGNVPIFKFTRKFGKNILFSLLANFKVKSLIDRYKIDKVIVQGGPGGIFLTKRLAIEKEY